MNLSRRELLKAGVAGVVLLASQGLSAVFSDCVHAAPDRGSSVVVDYSGPDSAEAIETQVKALSKKMPAFIMLASPTCVYCDALAETFEKASRQLAISVKVLKVDVGEFPEIKSGLRFRRVTPDTRAYENGAQKYSFMGAAPYENIVSGLREMSAAIRSSGTRPAP